jgi:hypothetical protein
MIVSKHSHDRGVYASLAAGAALAALLLLGLVGCKSATVDEACADYGFTPGTTAFAGCVQDESRDRRAMMRTFGDDIERTTNPRRGY